MTIFVSERFQNMQVTIDEQARVNAQFHLGFFDTDTLPEEYRERAVELLQANPNVVEADARTANEIRRGAAVRVERGGVSTVSRRALNQPVLEPSPDVQVEQIPVTVKPHVQTVRLPIETAAEHMEHEQAILDQVEELVPVEREEVSDRLGAKREEAQAREAEERAKDAPPPPQPSKPRVQAETRAEPQPNPEARPAPAPAPKSDRK